MIKSILAVDIIEEPETFVRHMCSVVTHLLLESTNLKNQSFLAPFSASTQQNDILLREVVYIMLTVREILSRVNPERLNVTQLAEFMISKMSSDLYHENPLRKNLQKLAVEFLFVAAVLLPASHLAQTKKALIHSLHSTLKA